MNRIILIAFGLTLLIGCSPKLDPNQVLLKTNKGDILIQLYDDTPIHKDNFLKLAKEGDYDGLLFHRVISEFMIQGGDFDSKDAQPGEQLGEGGPAYTLEAEIDYPKHFHKKGALAAARMGDKANPERRSSGSQFYIVQGKVLDDKDLAKAEKRLLSMQKENIFYKIIEQYKDSLQAFRKAGDQQSYMDMQIKINEMVDEQMKDAPSVAIPEDIKEVYKTIGGVPHLDGSYTVFGEVIEGLNVVDSIAAVKCDKYDRPLEDVVIEKVITGKIK